MATKKAAVLGSSGLIEELQSGDTLDGLGGGGGDPFYMNIWLGGFEEANTFSATTPASRAEFVKFIRGELPSSFTATFRGRGHMASGTASGEFVLQAVNGGTTTLGTINVTAGTTSNTWFSVDVTSNLSSLASGTYDLEVTAEVTSGAGSIRYNKGLLEIVG